MLLAYLDESYNKRLFCLSALVADDATVVVLTRQLNQIVETIRARYPEVVELHGHEIFQAVETWRQVPIRLRMNAYLSAARAVRDAGVSSLFVEVERVGDLSDSTPAHETALRRLLERLQRFADARDDRMLVLADEVHSAERHRTNFRFYQDNEDALPSPGKLDRIIDTLYFGPSHHSRMLQVADLFTYMRLRRLTVAESDERAERVNEAIWANIEPTIVAGGPSSPGKHEGPGLATGA
ncbi:MAG: DUF3800 domain-containing protein [Propionibacteriaceae bacterium]|jgi:hypothetical protein|nr:DUF3800 domain-containing protein [Propionibacteriaceae bacterium]